MEFSLATLRIMLVLRASFPAVLNSTLATIVAVASRARIALTARLERVVGVWIGESGFTFARKTALVVDALSVRATVVQFRSTTFI